MKRFFSASTLGWYLDVVHATMPEDAKPVSDDLYLSLLGKSIEADEDGMPREKIAAAPTADEVRASVKAAVAAKRYAGETGGLTLPNGIRVDTAREDQAAIANTLVVWPETGLDTISFKAASGFVILTMEELKAIAGAIGILKQACYEAERVHLVAIAGTSDEDLLSYDVDAGWPEGALPASEAGEGG